MITKCPCCGHISYETTADIKELANEALDEAASLMQDKLGVKTGDLASHFFSDDRVIDNFNAYILSEIQFANEHAKEVVDAGNQTKR